MNRGRSLRGDGVGRGINGERREEGFEEREKERRGEFRGLESFMWELQGAAPRVSGESERFGGVDGREGESASILG